MSVYWNQTQEGLDKCLGVHQRMLHDLAIERSTRSLLGVNIAQHRIKIESKVLTVQWHNKPKDRLAATPLELLIKSIEWDNINNLKRNVSQEKWHVPECIQKDSDLSFPIWQLKKS